MNMRYERSAPELLASERAVVGDGIVEAGIPIATEPFVLKALTSRIKDSRLESVPGRSKVRA